jgi:hypothetical protein
MMGGTTFGFDATDPEETNDSGRAEKRPDRRAESSRKRTLRSSNGRATLSWSRGHTVEEHLCHGYDAMVAACRREFARYEHLDCDEYLGDEADCDDDQG